MHIAMRLFKVKSHADTSLAEIAAGCYFNYDKCEAQDRRALEVGQMPINELELRVYGLMRSGNHAIIEWILSLYPGGKTCFLNNVEHGANDPFVTTRKFLLSGFESPVGLQACRSNDRTLLVYSYEDRKLLQETGISFLDSVFDPDFERHREDYLGQSRTRRNVLILRDPFNCFASRLKMIHDRGAKGGMKDLSEIAQNWKALATRARGIRDCGDEREIVILFNDWVGKRAYRKAISQNLGGQYSEASMRRTSTFGGGSSFMPNGKARYTVTGLKPRPRVFSRVKGIRKIFYRLLEPMVPRWYKVKMLNRRWHSLRSSAEFRQLFRDPDILQLSEALFGEMPGTRNFVRDVTSQYASKTGSL